MAWRLFGLDVTASVLPSYYDQNFRLEQAGQRWVLKISRTGADSGVLDMQNRVMSEVGSRVEMFAVSSIWPTLNGDPMATVSDRCDGHHQVRLLTYVEGTPWSAAANRSVELLRSLGRAVGEFECALEGFSHPAMYCDDDWDLKNFPRVRCYLDAIRTPERQQRVLALLDRFEHTVIPQLGALPKAVIHGDINNDNVLVDGDRVVGLIDFGDVVYSTRVFEIAIAMAYGLLGSDDPLRVGNLVLAGYEEVTPLTAAEREIVFHLACCRLATSAAFGTYFGRRDPQNTYVGANVAASWEALDQLESASS